MWTRNELKDKAKVSFKGNYWKAVLIGLVVLAIGTGVGASGTGAAQTSSTFDDPLTSYQSGYQDGYTDGYYDWRDSSGISPYSDEYGPSYEYDDDYLVSPTPMLTGAQQAAMAVGVATIVLAVVALAFAVAVLIGGPLEVGARRFFLRNLNQKADTKELMYAFDHNYLATVKVIFFRDLFIVLWSLLFLVPGIVKAYEYRMIPYLLAEDPTMTKDQAFAESKRLMTGQKWNTFVLDLSFLGWDLLATMTLGILEVFYVVPYRCQTNAALYEKLRYGMPDPNPQAAPFHTQPVPPVDPAGAAPAQPMGSAPSAPMGGAPTAPMGFGSEAAAYGYPTAPVAPVPPAAQTASMGSASTAPTGFAAEVPPVPPARAMQSQSVESADERESASGTADESASGTTANAASVPEPAQEGAEPNGQDAGQGDCASVPEPAPSSEEPQDEASASD